MNQCFKGVKKSVVCAREGGANTTPLFPAAHFAKQNTKFGGGESEGEAGIHFPQAPFSARLARAKSFVSAARSAAISQYFVQKRFALRSVIATNLNIANFAGSLFARSPRLRRGFARIFPYISAQNQRAFENQKSVFCPAGGGSALRCNSQIKFVSNFFQCRKAALRSQFFNPALFPPKAEWPKATY